MTREQRETIVDNIRDEYRPKVRRVTAKVERTRAAYERDQDRQKAEQLDTIVAVGSTVLGALFGRKNTRRRSSSRSRSSATAARNRSAKIRHDYEAAAKELDALRREVETKIKDLDFTIKPTKSNIDVGELTLTWAPFRVTETGAEPAWTQKLS